MTSTHQDQTQAFARRASFSLLIISGLLSSLSAGISAANSHHEAPLAQARHQSTISAANSKLTHQAQQEHPLNGNMHEPTSSGPTETTTIDGVAAMMDAHYLDRPPLLQSAGASIHQADSATHFEEISDNSISAFGSSLAKTRRQAEQQAKSLDWWTKLVAKSKQNVQSDKPASKAPMYREQPLNQNAILTIRHQLMAIRDKHQLLMVKSVPQLIQLDQRLIDSYSLCFKRNMPLYAGMLYRTRDYVAHMANEIKHERQLLEAMTKQIQKALRHKMTNNTLVKEYNRHLAAVESQSLDADKSSKTSSSQMVPQFDSEPSATSAPAFSSTKQRVFNADPQRESKSHSKSTPNKSPLSRGSTSAYQRTGKHLAPNAQGVVHHQEHSDGDDEHELIPQQQNDNEFYNLATSTSTTRTSATTTTKRPPASQKSTYTVHINEVNIKRELVKSQALIDRVNTLSHELNAVVDDIIFLFKLTSNDPKRGLASGKTNKFEKMRGNLLDLASNGMDQKRAKKMMLKSPYKVFFERFGKMTMSDPTAGAPASGSSPRQMTPSDQGTNMRSTTASDINTMTSSSFLDINMNNLPEMKPLFDSAKSFVYTDPVDLDLGFDAPITLDSQ